MHATEILDYTDSDIQSLQRTDNQVYRAILGMPSYTATCALRSGIGASSAKARDIKNKIMFVKHVLDDEANALVKEIFLKQFYGTETEYIKKIKQYMKILDVNLESINNLTREKIKEKVNRVDSEMWKAEMENKETLTIYKSYKVKISEIKWYDNTLKTNLMIKARTDTLELNWRKRHKQESTQCICGYENETLEHFILDCEEYSDTRKKFDFAQQPYIENRSELMANVLLFQTKDSTEIEKRKDYILELWLIRKKKLEAQSQQKK